ncbi:MAG: T9SS type A sorting domain-containing protein [Flavobacteriaceae bacterium]|nr:MAG: T9SS type A sorting domain-containing protein [Flavobacteriaceae bacterium]
MPVFSQIPPGYYSTVTGSGYILKSQLKTIITNGHTDRGYSALYNAYTTTDTDTFYENDHTVLDMYSENPAGPDPYNYIHNDRNCGNYNSENDCYNREHIFPQGFFNEQFPMRSDIHHVVPSDGFVNNRRANYPFGEISTPTWTSSNGSKVGPNTYDTYTGVVFEPIDEFKGDIARMLLYFATRYEDDVTHSSWDTHTTVNNPLNGTNDQIYEDWYIRLLHKWHTEDPVSQREITRNNEAYTFQGNRNPYIDHPEYVSMIWGSVLAVDYYTQLKKVVISPNPSPTNSITLTISEGLHIDSVAIYSVPGKQIYKNTLPGFTNNKLTITNLKSGIYVLRLLSNKQSVSKKIIIE